MDFSTVGPMMQSSGKYAIKNDVIKEKSIEFEAVFLGQMMVQVMNSSKSSSEFNGGFAEDTWRSFLAQEYGKSIAENGGIGIAQSIEGALRSYGAK
jgi:Rod binding domain-containing protein